MNEILQNLVKLQSIEFDEVEEKNAEATVAELRGKIPQQILGHYDRLGARGKKGVAAIRDQVCTGCHMRLPIGVVTTVMHGLDIQLCDTCGRYLYMPAAAESEPAPKPAAPKRVGRPRKRKVASPDQS